MQIAIDFEDAAACAAAVIAGAKMEGEERPDPVLVARAHGVPVYATDRRFMVGRIGDSAEVDGRQAIYVRKGVDGPLLLFTVAHELGHVCLRRWGRRVEGEEAWCNAFAGALVLPHHALVEEWRRGGELRAVLRRWRHLPPTCVALRLGETHLADVFVVQQRALRYARAKVAPTPALLEVGHATAAGARRRAGPGIRAARLSDGAVRAVVVATA
jgi:hypothetical protein